MTDREVILAHLNRRRPNPTTTAVPVFAKTSLGVVMLGTAETHEEAEAHGLGQGIRCEKISRGCLSGDDRTFFLLRP